MTAQNLTVMSYNIRLDTPSDSADSWPHRKKSVVQMIQKHQVDILGTQEGLTHQIKELGEFLPDYQWVGVGRDDGKEAGEMMAIFFKKSRFDLLNSGHFWLSEQPDVPGTRSWNSACARMLTWVQLQDKISGNIFFHFNSHFDHISAEARAKGAQLIGGKLPQIAQNALTFFTADMNFTPKDPVYQNLQKTWFDSQKLATKAKHQNSSFNAFRSRKEGMLIDYIWINNPQKVKVKSYEIDESKNEKSRFPSDHFPVIVKLKLL
jgi:endonuclease/exonuclease/phosphatase family metal-dependent hydrolase